MKQFHVLMIVVPRRGRQWKAKDRRAEVRILATTPASSVPAC